MDPKVMNNIKQKLNPLLLVQQKFAQACAELGDIDYRIELLKKLKASKYIVLDNLEVDAKKAEKDNLKAKLKEKEDEVKEGSKESKEAK